MPFFFVKEADFSEVFQTIFVQDMSLNRRIFSGLTMSKTLLNLN